MTQCISSALLLLTTIIIISSSPDSSNAFSQIAGTSIIHQQRPQTSNGRRISFLSATADENGKVSEVKPKSTQLKLKQSTNDNDNNNNHQQQQIQQQLLEQRLDQPTQNRRFFMAMTAAATTSIFTAPAQETQALATDSSSSSSSSSINNADIQLPWKVDPVNKRSGVKVNTAEKSGYNVAFVTYLARFLLNFDTNCQKVWFNSSKISRTATAEQVEQFRIDQFAAFSASVELGLLEYKGTDGPKQLLQDLVRRYGSTTTSSSDNPQERRISRSARRHIALMFALMEKNQPTQDITKLLASVDNGSVAQVQLLNANNNNETNNMFSGYELQQPPPQVTFNPPQAGEDYEVAEGKAIMKSTGKLLRLKTIDPGSGYSSNPPVIAVSPPKDPNGIAAKVQCKVSKQGGTLTDIKLVDPGSGYTAEEAIEVRVEPPAEAGQLAILEPVLNMAVDRIEITKGGTGYAVEKPLKVFLESPPSTSSNTQQQQQPILAGFAFPTAERSSFTSFRQDIDTQKMMEQEQSFEQKYKLKPSSTSTTGTGTESTGIRGALTGVVNSGAPPLPFWTGRSSSAELLRLLPAGIGLEYDKSQQRYALAVDTNFMAKYPAVLQQGSNRLLGTEFGPRGRAPIERDMELGLSAYLRFCLSGATCASLVHVALTPLDVVKTKTQIDNVKYPNIGSSFQRVFREEGIPTFFSGWLPTLLGNFAAGGVLYVTTEYIRRGLSEAAGTDALALEVPIILAAAGVASALGAILLCPFEAVRIRTVAQPNYAPGGSINVAKKMLDEEGIAAFVDAIPIFLVRNVPYAMTKFTIFDLSTERIYENFPAAQEDIRLSLLVSLLGGVLGGTAAAAVSNPADAVISELKKAKSDISPQQAVANMLERNGIATFFVGLPLRMVFYSLVASLTFVVYDFVRFLLGIGSDDLKLYLDVLGGSLANPS